MAGFLLFGRPVNSQSSSQRTHSRWRPVRPLRIEDLIPPGLLAQNYHTGPVVQPADDGRSEPGPERTLRPSSASVTVPVWAACWQRTVQLADRPFQLAVMVTEAVPVPA